MKRMKIMLSVLLTLAMVFSMMPVSVFADEGGGTPSDDQTSGGTDHDESMDKDYENKELEDAIEAAQKEADEANDKAKDDADKLAEDVKALDDATDKLNSDIDAYNAGTKNLDDQKAAIEKDSDDFKQAVKDYDDALAAYEALRTSGASVAEVTAAQNALLAERARLDAWGQKLESDLADLKTNADVLANERNRIDGEKAVQQEKIDALNESLKSLLEGNDKDNDDLKKAYENAVEAYMKAYDEANDLKKENIDKAIKDYDEALKLYNEGKEKFDNETLPNWQTEKDSYDAALKKYNEVDFPAWEAAEKAYKDAWAAYEAEVKDIMKDFEGDQEAYEKAVADALAKFNGDMEAYNKAIEDYKDALDAYNKAKKEYDDKKDEHERLLQEWEERYNKPIPDDAIGTQDFYFVLTPNAPPSDSNINGKTDIMIADGVRLYREENGHNKGKFFFEVSEGAKQGTAVITLKNGGNYTNYTLYVTGAGNYELTIVSQSGSSGFGVGKYDSNDKPVFTDKEPTFDGKEPNKPKDDNLLQPLPGKPTEPAPGDKPTEPKFDKPKPEFTGKEPEKTYYGLIFPKEFDKFVEDRLGELPGPGGLSELDPAVLIELIVEWNLANPNNPIVPEDDDDDDDDDRFSTVRDNRTPAGAATANIPDAQVPLANAPLTSIEDGEVPLAALPKTGGKSAKAGISLIGSLLALAGGLVLKSKSEEEEA